MKLNIPILLTAALLSAPAVPAAASGPASDNAGAAERRVFIDPETGERRQPTAEELDQSGEATTSANHRSRQNEAEIIDGPDGSKMIIHDREDWPKHRMNNHGSAENSN